MAERGSLLFFQIDQLAKIDPMYQFSLEAFEVVFNKALKKAKPAETVEERVENIMKSITETLFAFVSRGLFGRHSLIFSTMLCFAILKKREELDPQQMSFLLRGERRSCALLWGLRVRALPPPLCGVRVRSGPSPSRLPRASASDPTGGHCPCHGLHGKWAR